MRESSNLLINEPPLQVLPSLATKLGLTEAIILQQIHYWLQINKKKSEPMDGRYWTYNSYGDWQKEMPWWSVDTIKDAILRLERKGILISCQPNTKNWDRTKHYSINYDVLENTLQGDKAQEKQENHLIDRGNFPPSEGEGFPNLHITEINTETIITREKEISAPAKEEKSRVIKALQEVKPIMDHTGLNVLDLSKFPDDVKPWVGRVCQLWKLKPPTGKARSYWIESARCLQDACGEFGLSLLDIIRAEYEAYMHDNQGLPPFSVSGPGSLEKKARSVAGLKRWETEAGPSQQEQVNENDFFDRSPKRR